MSRVFPAFAFWLAACASGQRMGETPREGDPGARPASADDSPAAPSPEDAGQRPAEVAPDRADPQRASPERLAGPSSESELAPPVATRNLLRLYQAWKRGDRGGRSVLEAWADDAPPFGPGGKAAGEGSAPLLVLGPSGMGAIADVPRRCRPTLLVLVAVADRVGALAEGESGEPFAYLDAGGPAPSLGALVASAVPPGSVCRPAEQVLSDLLPAGDAFALSRAAADLCPNRIGPCALALIEWLRDHPQMSLTLPGPHRCPEGLEDAPAACRELRDATEVDALAQGGAAERCNTELRAEETRCGARHPARTFLFVHAMRQLGGKVAPEHLGGLADLDGWHALTWPAGPLGAEHLAAQAGLAGRLLEANHPRSGAPPVGGLLRRAEEAAALARRLGLGLGRLCQGGDPGCEQARTRVEAVAQGASAAAAEALPAAVEAGRRQAVERLSRLDPPPSRDGSGRPAAEAWGRALEALRGGAPSPPRCGGGYRLRGPGECRGGSALGLGAARRRALGCASSLLPAPNGGPSLHERELRELLCRHLRAVRDLARRRLDLEGLWPWLRDELRWARDCAAARRCSEATGWRTAADALCPCRRWWRGFAGQDGGLRRLERLLYEGRVALARHVTWARGLPDPHPRIRARRDELVAMYEAVDGLRRSVRRTQNALVHGAMPLLDDSGRDTAFRRLRRAAELLDRRGWQRPESFRKSWEEQDDLWRQLRHLR